MNTSKFNALTIFGGGYYEERRQALGKRLASEASERRSTWL